LQEALAMDDGSKENAIKEEKRRELTQALRDDIAAVNEIEETLKKQEEIERFDRRIKELEGDFAAMSQALEQAEKAIYLTELFTIVKADQLTSSINAYFDPSVLKFKLFEQLKNGGIEPTCEVLVKSKQGNYKEFRGANSAGKINAGLEIIHVLSKSYGKSIPIAIDNAEGVNRLNVRDAQVIATYVTRDPKLVIEPFDYM
jgi:exonuclease SbcC